LSLFGRVNGDAVRGSVRERGAGANKALRRAGVRGRGVGERGARTTRERERQVSGRREGGEWEEARKLGPAQRASRFFDESDTLSLAGDCV